MPSSNRDVSRSPELRPKAPSGTAATAGTLSTASGTASRIDSTPNATLGAAKGGAQQTIPQPPPPPPPPASQATSSSPSGPSSPKAHLTSRPSFMKLPDAKANKPASSGLVTVVQEQADTSKPTMHLVAPPVDAQAEAAKPKLKSKSIDQAAAAATHHPAASDKKVAPTASTDPERKNKTDGPEDATKKLTGSVPAEKKKPQVSATPSAEKIAVISVAANRDGTPSTVSGTVAGTANSTSKGTGAATGKSDGNISTIPAAAVTADADSSSSASPALAAPTSQVPGNNPDNPDNFLQHLRSKKSILDTKAGANPSTATLNPGLNPGSATDSTKSKSKAKKMGKAATPSIMSLRSAMATGAAGAAGAAATSSAQNTVSSTNTPASKGSTRAEFFAAKLHDAIKDEDKDHSDSEETFVYDTAPSKQEPAQAPTPTQIDSSEPLQAPVEQAVSRATSIAAVSEKRRSSPGLTSSTFDGPTGDVPAVETTSAIATTAEDGTGLGADVGAAATDIGANNYTGAGVGAVMPATTAPLNDTRKVSRSRSDTADINGMQRPSIVGNTGAMSQATPSASAAKRENSTELPSLVVHRQPSFNGSGSILGLGPMTPLETDGAETVASSVRAAEEASQLNTNTNNTKKSHSSDMHDDLREITTRVFDSKGVPPRKYSGNGIDDFSFDGEGGDSDEEDAQAFAQQQATVGSSTAQSHSNAFDTGGASAAAVAHSGAGPLGGIPPSMDFESDFEDDYYMADPNRKSIYGTFIPPDPHFHANTVPAYHGGGPTDGSESQPLVDSMMSKNLANGKKLRKKRNNIYFNPHDFTSARATRLKQLKNFCYTVGLIFSLLFIGFICGFILATSKELQGVKVTDVSDLLISDEEFVFNMGLEAFNPGIMPISIKDAQLDVFAKSKYVIDDYVSPIELESKKKKDSSYNTILLGTVQELEIPLHFQGGCFTRAKDHSETQLKIVNPCSYSDKGGDGGDDGNDDSTADSDNKLHIDKPSTDLPPDVHTPNMKWLNISKNPFELIIRGVLSYQLPVSSVNRTVAVSFTRAVNPDTLL